MKQIRSEMEVQATPERVWQVLTDLASFPDWNPFIRSALGELREGARLKIRIHPPGGMGMTFKPTVIKLEPPTELRWSGRFLMPGLFDGEHFFMIEPTEEGRVRFIQGEWFTGAMVPMFDLMGALGKTLKGFEEMNQALRYRAERGA